MRKFLKILMLPLVVVFLLASVFIFYGTYFQEELDEKSHDFVDKNILSIIDGWSKDEYLKKRWPSQVDSDGRVSENFRRLAVLGRLVKYNGSTGEAVLTFTPKTDEILTAEYHATAVFEKSSAEIYVSLVRINGEWMFKSITVDSPYFGKK